MIRLLLKSGTNIEINRTMMRRPSVSRNIVQKKDPKTGNRVFIGGNYVNFSFDVLLNDLNVFNQLDAVRYQECNLEVDGVVLNLNGLPYVFTITNVNPFYLNNDTQYELVNVALGSSNWSPQEAQFLIDDLGNFIITDSGQKIIVGQ